MNQDLKIHLLQADLFWENKAKNLAIFDSMISNILQSDLIILPEMFSTGFTNNSKEYCEPMNGPTVEWMKKTAEAADSAICGSAIIQHDHHIFNRFLFIQPDGSISFYDKKHLFAMARENNYYAPGDSQILIEYKSWKICPMVCYDLRFPIWSRRRENDFNYDLLIYVASWPKARINAWTTLLKARSIENMSYCAGLNRIGSDHNKLEYPGASIVVDPLGKVISETDLNKEQVIEATLEKQILINNRLKLPFQSDADPFVLN